jgi:hypothetical protein
VISLEPTDASERELKDFLRRLEAIAAPASARVEAVQTAIRAGFADVFTSEGAAGAAPWAQLAEATRRERERLGFPPAHPILERTGDYRGSFTDAGHTDHVSEWSAGGGVWRIAEGSRHELAQYHEQGTARMPARPATAFGAAVTGRVETALDELFREWLGRL